MYAVLLFSFSSFYAEMASIEIATTALFMQQQGVFNRLFLYTQREISLASIQALIYSSFLYIFIYMTHDKMSVLVFLSPWLFHSNDKTIQFLLFIMLRPCIVILFFYYPRKNTNFHLSSRCTFKNKQTRKSGFGFNISQF